MQFGLNLYSLRNRMQTEENLKSLTVELREGGYSYLQYSGAAFHPEMIARVSEETGMPFVLTHVPMQDILERPEQLCREHKLFGCSRIGLGSIPGSLFCDIDAFRKLIRELNASAERMAAQGCKFFYHNHFLEFTKYGSRTFLEIFAEEAPLVNFTLDTYWIQYGGGDCKRVFEELDGRMECVHLKDYAVDAAAGKPVFAPVGDGVLNFPEIIASAKKHGAAYFLVEQDNAADLPDGFAQIMRSAAYLKNI